MVAVNLVHLGEAGHAQGGGNGALRGGKDRPPRSTWAGLQARGENSGAKARKTAIIVAGRVGIVAPPGSVATSLPYCSSLQRAKVELRLERVAPAYGLPISR